MVSCIRLFYSPQTPVDTSYVNVDRFCALVVAHHRRCLTVHRRGSMKNRVNIQE